MLPPATRDITFTVSATPSAKARARISSRHGTRRFYTPTKTMSFEAEVRAAVSKAVAGAPPLRGPVDVEVLVRFAPLISTSKVKAQAMIEGLIVPAKAPDIDNLAKIVLDGCARVAFVDDRQVIRLVAEKMYASAAGVDVVIRARQQKAG